jgi:uncharacterized membrane protein YgcG
MVRKIVATILMFTAPLVLAQTAAPGSTPQLGTPVVSQPMKPGECVVACVPGATGGGAGGSFGGGTFGIGGGSSSGGCQMFCAPVVEKAGGRAAVQKQGGVGG